MEGFEKQHIKNVKYTSSMDINSMNYIEGCQKSMKIQKG